MKKKRKDPKKLSVGEQINLIKHELGYQTMEKPPKSWLKTQWWRLNAVMGSKKKGIPYGKLVLIAGDYSSGKTLVGNLIMGLAQQDGATPCYIDPENSADPVFSKRMSGLDFGAHIGADVYEKVALIRPEVGVFAKTKKDKKKKSKPRIRLETAEEMFVVGERWLFMQREINPRGKIVVLVDSMTAIVPEEELMADVNEQNMRTRMSPAQFNNMILKRWQNLALNTNALIIMISQIRIDPTAMFGNPERIPGGKGMVFYPHVIVQVRRANKGGTIKDSEGNVIGLRSVIKNLKNKAGGGSVEGRSCGFKAYFRKNKWQFTSAKDLKE